MDETGPWAVSGGVANVRQASIVPTPSGRGHWFPKLGPTDRQGRFTPESEGNLSYRAVAEVSRRGGQACSAWDGFAMVPDFHHASQGMSS